jgi:divinyl protochlorophyllide a 8-vinyl-reductase
VIRLGEAIALRHGGAVAAEVLAAGGFPGALADPPDGMIEAARVAALYRAMAERFGAEADAIAAAAGRRTADYVLENRIPGPLRALFGVLPAGLGARLLLDAIRRNAWTFGSGKALRTAAGNPCRIEIGADPLGLPGAPWHRAVFERLFRRLVCAEAEVKVLAGPTGPVFEVGWAAQGRTRLPARQAAQ